MHQDVTLPKACSSVMQPRFRTGRVQRPGTVTNSFGFTSPEHRLLLIGRSTIEYRMLKWPLLRLLLLVRWSTPAVVIAPSKSTMPEGEHRNFVSLGE